MKKFALFAVVTILFFSSATTAQASWKVTIRNQSTFPYTVKVYGEHLFWRQVDCEILVPGRGEVSCVMPGLICPAAIDIVNDNESKHSIVSIARCLNTQLDIKGEINTNTFTSVWTWY